MEPNERLSDPERRADGSLDRQHFGGLFACGDMEECDGGESEEEGDTVADLFVVDGQAVHQRGQEIPKDGFADPTQTKTCQGNA